MFTNIIAAAIIFNLFGITQADVYVEQLFEHLLKNYNKNVRPVKNASDALVVKFGANLFRLIDVDEVNEVLTTSLWLEIVSSQSYTVVLLYTLSVKQWTDSKLSWNPEDWGGTKKIHIPSDEIWIPDILLYNKYVCAANPHY
ncbi:unnamed protein product [Anisakis simplex]|uniref:Neur_chan_LBD domain-containing protein n=1 Tax=Anisakis simplex TaxID=6269 RepID=A0A0M3J1A6_ANISI|nr:unnamed protein product [Anisakis simplex]